MANISACLSSKTDDWATPQAFFDKLNEEFHFTLDPCADENNHKCSLYFTKEQDGLTKDWGGKTWFSAILLTEKKLETGFATLTSRATNRIQRWLCLSRHERTLDIFTTTSMKNRKSVLYEDV